MRIRRIKVRNYGGIDEAEVSFPDDGITIIEGVNEAGKTSLIDAVDAILSLQDSSTHRSIKAIVPVGKDVGPEVEVDFTAGAYEFTYRKRWIRNKETILDVSKPAREQLTGREAHDRVKEILDEAVDLELWQALRLDQGTALVQANFEVSALGRALDAAAGGDIAGDREDVLWNRVEAEYGQYWTGTGKPKGNLGEAKKNLGAAVEEAEKANAHLRELDGHADEIQRLESDAVDLHQTHSEAATNLDNLTGQVADVAKLRQAVETAKGELELANLNHQKAQSDRQRRDDLVEAAETAADELESVTEEVNRSVPAREVIVEKATSAQEAREAARSAWEAAQRVHVQARSDSEYRRQQIEIEQLTERRDRVDKAQQRLAQADQTVDSITIDDALLEEIEDAHLELAKVQAAADRALPTVALEALGKTRVVIDGVNHEMDSGDVHSLVVHDAAHIVVPDVVQVSIGVGVDNAEVAKGLEEAGARYEDLCGRAGVSDFAAARVHADRRASALRDRVDAAETIERDLRDLTLEALSNKVDRLITHTAEFEASRGAEPSIPADLTTAQDLERVAEETVTETLESLERADALAQEAAEDLNRFDVDDAGLKARFEIAESTTASAKQTLAAARDEQSDKRLAEAETATATEVDEAESCMATVETQLAQADPDSLDALLANAKAAQSRSIDDLRTNEDRRKELQIKLAIETERGPAQYADEAETNLIEAGNRFERLNSRADAARLLFETLRKHRKAARQRYNQPFRDRIEDLGRIVYDSTFEVLLGDDLSIESRTLDGTTLDFGQLSTGAQEQLGLLARLACATLVAHDGGAPVIFDDALGWTDPGRLDRMSAAISMAADDCQVIILTCVPKRYSAVGKARTVNI